jgi:hypothetical protein
VYILGTKKEQVMALRGMVVGMLGAVCVAGAWAGRSQPQQVGAVESRVPVVQWTGPDSSIDEPGFVRVTDQAAWGELWARHRGDRLEHNLRRLPVVPTIDFDRYMIVATFAARGAENDGEIVQEMMERDDALVIRFASLTFQTLTIGDPDAATQRVKGSAYGIWLIPRRDGPIVIEQDQRQLLNQPAKWVQVHRFERLGA